LTTIAAVAVLLPWVIDKTHIDSAHPSAADTVLAEQPLNGLGGGVSIREVSQTTPFSMVASPATT